MRKVITALVVAMATCLAAASAAAADPGPIQVSGQSADTSQQAAAASGATQTDPSNTNVSIRVLSPGSDGPVSQSNTAASSAAAGNAASTTQNADQSAGGGGGIQSSQQSAGTDQSALALSEASQTNPSNTNIPIRVLSPGSDGSVTQSNNALSSAQAGNSADTTQSSSQDPPGPSSAIQTSDQSANTDQSAAAASAAKQIDPSNTNVSIRVLSPGSNGSVSQSNNAASSANAGNDASTSQTSSQTAGGSDPIQVAKQDASTEQKAAALSAAYQDNPSNTATSVRVLSPGNDGNVSQSNNALSSAKAGNKADTTQNSTQDPSGSAIQASDQSAETEQAAFAASLAAQSGASNEASPVRVLSPGSNGNVSQSNNAASSATAGNEASTTQDASQSASSGDPIQVAKQDASTEQKAAALSAAVQHDPSNTADPVRVLSPGGGGNVNQSNNALSSAKAGNSADTTQSATQDPSGPSIQVIGQQADTDQAAFAASLAAQSGASNDASPVRVLSPGSDGNVSQSNNALSSAAAGNEASTMQDASQTASYGGPAIQVIGQSASTEQKAAALSAALQHDPSNTADPVRVLSPGGGGNVNQSNNAASAALAGNAAETNQHATQDPSGPTIQVIGQQAETDQAAFAASAAAQLGASNDASPVRVLSPGSDGNVSQSNNALSLAAAGNEASTTQDASQTAGGGGLQIQVLGQQSETEQAAIAASLAAQFGASNTADPVRVLSPGGGGNVNQSNTAASAALAGNAAETNQSGRQTIAGSHCSCAQLPIQVAGQSAETAQLAAAFSAALQVHPKNDSSPVSVLSPGGAGSVFQANNAASFGAALNLASTMQGVSQTS